LLLPLSLYTRLPTAPNSVILFFCPRHSSVAVGPCVDSSFTPNSPSKALGSWVSYGAAARCPLFTSPPWDLLQPPVHGLLVPPRGQRLSDASCVRACRRPGVTEWSHVSAPWPGRPERFPTFSSGASLQPRALAIYSTASVGVGLVQIVLAGRINQYVEGGVRRGHRMFWSFLGP